jgi:fructose-specific phosphotransferase system IIC component
MAVMSDTKKRQVALSAALVAGFAAFALATGLSELWPVIVGLAAGGIIRLLRRVDDSPKPPNLVSKTIVLVLSACVGAICMIWGAGHDWRWAVLGAFLLAPTLVGIWLVAHGRHPWWL